MTKPSKAGRTVPIMVRVTEDAAKVIDKQRAKASRAEYLRQAAAEKVSRDTGKKQP